MQVSGFNPVSPMPLQARQALATGGGASDPATGPSLSRGQGGHAHDRDADTVSLSPAALADNKQHQATPDAPHKQSDTDDSNSAQPDDQSQASAADPDRKTIGKALTKEEEKQVQELKDRDRETRTHEQAHKNAAGPFAQGGPVFEYQQGPDGRRYAVGGHVNIDTSAVPGDPQATIQKMQVVRRAALAPSSPSGQDRKVAAQASQAQQKARAELRQSREDENNVTDDRDTQAGSAHKPPGSPGSPASPDDQGLLLDVSA